MNIAVHRMVRLQNIDKPQPTLRIWPHRVSLAALPAFQLPTPCSAVSADREAL